MIELYATVVTVLALFLGYGWYSCHAALKETDEWKRYKRHEQEPSHD